MKTGVAEAEALVAGAAELGLDLPASGKERLLCFLALLRRWNRACNLVARAPPGGWMSVHLLDSLSIAARLRAAAAGAPPQAPPADPRRRPPRRILDAGSGAGLPGIPLAVALPELHFVLLDANGKKARFCRHAASVLQLPNVDVAEARAEGYAPSAPFDAAVVRAVGRLAHVRDLVRPLCRGPILAMKGRYPAGELQEIAAASPEVVRLRVPGLDAERHLVILQWRESLPEAESSTDAGSPFRGRSGRVARKRG